jgi:hypothetical protein
MKLIETLLLLNFCHLLGDFTHLSTNWMLNAKRLGKPLFPILIHAYVHATLFFFAVWFIQDIYMAIIAFSIQAPTHFLIDVLKGRMNGWFPKLQDPSNKLHWITFGTDQFGHQVVIIFTAYITCLYN